MAGACGHENPVSACIDRVRGALQLAQDNRRATPKDRLKILSTPLTLLIDELQEHGYHSVPDSDLASILGELWAMLSKLATQDAAIPLLARIERVMNALNWRGENDPLVIVICIGLFF